MRILNARKRRHGFPPLYITAITSGGVKRSKLRFLRKEIQFERRQWEFGVVIPGEHQAYNSSADIDRITGRASYSETGGGDLSLADNRAAAQGNINSAFAARKGTTGTAITNSFGDPTYAEEVFFSGLSDGIDQTSFSYSGDFYSEYFGGLGYRYKTTITITVDLATEYTDDNLKTDVLDLLENHSTGSANGLDGMADNTIATIWWNENNVNAILGDPAATNGACWFDVNALSGYNTPAAAATIVNTSDAASWWALTGQWWQHTAGSHSNGEVIAVDPGYSKFNCNFSHDPSMPFWEHTDEAWERQYRMAIRFNVPHMVCGEFDLIDNNSAPSLKCVLSGGGSGANDLYEPDPVALSNSNIRRSAGTCRFTAPGALTGGGCPCSAAP